VRITLTEAVIFAANHSHARLLGASLKTDKGWMIESQEFHLDLKNGTPEPLCCSVAELAELSRDRLDLFDTDVSGPAETKAFRVYVP
jgi:hypothetical protein